MIAVAMVVAVICVVVAGLLRAGGASLLRTPRADALHDAADEVPGASRAASLLDDREAIVPSVNIVHTVLFVIAALLGGWVFDRLTEGPMLALAIAAFGLGMVALGALLPRRMGRERAPGLGYRLAPLVALGVAAGSRAADIIRNGEEDDDDGDGDHDEEDQEEIDLITSVLEFSETLVREVMVPRPDMVTIASNAPVVDLIALIEEHGYSRVPVAGEGVDDIVGVVIVKDLIAKVLADELPETPAEVMRPVDFVPETKRVPDLLREMQASKSHMAVVVDEYGGTAGLVTIEDLLEELVGEIVDEYDEDELLIEATADGGWQVDGRLPVSELSEIVGHELPNDEWDTVGGLVLGLAGRVPIEGEAFDVDAVSLQVVRVQGRRVAEVMVMTNEVLQEDAG